jgi:hypothetical protein
MRAGKRIIYWCTAVLLAWLMDERHWPQSVLTGIQDVVSEVESGKAILFTSVISRSEIFMGKLTPEQKTKYAKLMQRKNVTEILADTRIMDRSSYIREFYVSARPKKSITTPDGIHLATAILYKADEFQTMDGFEKDGTRITKLLALNGDVAGSKLSVVVPYPRSNPPSGLVGIEGPLFRKEIGNDAAGGPGGA